MDNGLQAQLEQLIRAIEASGAAVLPSSSDELLETIVQAAARLFGAAAASIALVDEQDDCIVFRVAYGAGRDEVVGLRIQPDEGIAGYVVNSGQPIAISDVQHDPRFAREAAQKTGYVPRSILAMPLYRHDRVIGVMEVLDKINAPAFGMQDMELLGLFARQAAIAIDQSQQIGALNQSLVEGLKRLAQGEQVGELLKDSAKDDPSRGRLMEIAGLFRSLAELGEAEQELCLNVLRAFAGYNRTRPRLGHE